MSSFLSYWPWITKGRFVKIKLGREGQTAEVCRKLRALTATTVNNSTSTYSFLLSLDSIYHMMTKNMRNNSTSVICQKKMAYVWTREGNLWSDHQSLKLHNCQIFTLHSVKSEWLWWFSFEIHSCDLKFF